MTCVRLPKHQSPVFPPACTACMIENPNSTVTLWSLSGSNWLSVLIPIYLLIGSKLDKVRAPFCRGCAWRLRFRRFGYTAALLLLVFGTIYFTQGLLPKAPGFVRRLALAVIGIVVLLPLCVWNALRPPSLGLNREGEDLVYEFRSEPYAERFRSMNPRKG
jgi:hypothetical protein